MYIFGKVTSSHTLMERKSHFEMWDNNLFIMATRVLAYYWTLHAVTREPIVTYE